MYSVVLMLALTAGGNDATAHHHGGRGCCGCCGGCYGGCGGCYGGCYGGGYGCYGGGGCCGGGWGCGGGCYGGYAYGGSMGGGYMGGGNMGRDGSKGGNRKDEISAPATIVVSLPADAKLMFDDYATNTTSATRTFETPALPTGRDYSYTVKAEVVRDGKAVTDVKQITVRAGQVTRAKFDLPATSVAAR